MTRPIPIRARRRGGGRGALKLITGLLVASALIRIASEGGTFLTRAFAEAGPVAPDGSHDKAQCPADEAAFAKMNAAFQDREKRLEQRETALIDRTRALSVTDATVSRKLEELRSTEAQLRKTLSLAASAEGKDLDQLTKVYESMKAKQAAALFEKMDPTFAAGFLGRMTPAAAAAIMAGLSPDVARSFSVVLAGRNARVPKN